MTREPRRLASALRLLTMAALAAVAGALAASAVSPRHRVSAATMAILRGQGLARSDAEDWP